MEKRIKIIDSLRGLAATMVVEHHLFSLNADHLKKLTKPFVFDILYWISEKNVAAVLFFFIISGFSIGLSLHKKPLNSKVSINDYLYRRAKRILPIYWFSIGLSLLLSIIIPTIHNQSFSIYNLLGNLLFLQTPDVVNSWFTPYGNNGPLWSLSYEFFFYLFAIPTVIINKKKNINCSNLFAFFLILGLLMIGINRMLTNPISAFLILYPIWLSGYILAQLYLNRNFDKRFFITMITALIFLVTMNRIYIKSSSVDVLALGIVISLFCSLIYSLYHLQDLYKIFNPLAYVINKLFYKIGLGSFSLYILHYIFLKLERDFGLSIYVQLTSVLLLFPICYYFETWIIKKRFACLKQQYV